MPLTVDDRLAVQDLMIRYAYCLDVNCTEEEFVELFTDNAIMESPVSGRHEGAEGVRQFLRKAVARRGKAQIRHIITNFLIDGEADRATLKAYFIETMTPLEILYPKSERNTEFLLAGTYDCTARKINGKWKLERRTVCVDARPGHALR
jgi:hypothetical protein